MALLDVGELLHQKAAAEDAAQAEAARSAELQQQMAQVHTLCCHCCLHSDRYLLKDCLCTSPELDLCLARSLVDRSICPMLLLLNKVESTPVHSLSLHQQP
jgi:hypothetical protein